jgi:glycosyltransferase involved in cell wall biosynthesis
VSRSPIRILRIISRLNVGGPARQVFWLSGGLRPLGYDTTIVTGRIPPNEDSLEPLFDRAGIPVIRFPQMEREIAPIRDLAAAWKLRGIIREQRPDLIHVHLSKAAFLARVARILSPGSRFPPVVYTHHGNRFRGYFSPLKQTFVRMTERALAPWTERFLVLSPQQRDEIAADLSIGRPAQYRVVPLAIDLSFQDRLAVHRGQLRHELGLPADRPLVGIVGRIAPIKNHAMFVDAAALVCRDWVGPHRPFFVIVGSGLQEEMQALRNRADAAGLRGDLRLLGTREDPAAFLADLDVVALTSLNEGTPLSLIEAMAAGRAIVATDVGGVRDLLTREWEDDPERPWTPSPVPRGLLVPSGDVEGFSAALIAVLHDRAVREKMSESAREFARSHFSVDRLCRDLDRIYRELLSDGSSKRQVPEEDRR